MEKWKLPPGWEWLPISTIAHDTDRRNPQSAHEVFFDYIDIGSINNSRGQIDPGSVKRIIGKDAPSRARKVIHTGDVLFATTRPYLRNIAIVPEGYDNQICSTGICVLCANQGRGLPGFLYYATRSNFFIEQLLPKQRGATYPAVSDDDVFSAEIPIPFPNDPARSMEEQSRSVSRIEGVFAELEEMRDIQSNIFSDTEKLPKVILINHLQELNHNRKPGWQLVNIDHNLIDVKSGFACARTNAVRDGIQHLRPFNINLRGEVVIGENTIRIPLDTKNDLEDYFLTSGDILFNNTNSVELVGKSAFVRKPFQVAFSNHINRLRVKNPNFLDPEWLVITLRYLFETGYFASKCNRWIGQAGFNISKLAETEILIPDLDTQKRVVSLIHNSQIEINEMEVFNTNSTNLISDLEESILAQAFRGEL